MHMDLIRAVRSLWTLRAQFLNDSNPGPSSQGPKIIECIAFAKIALVWRSTSNYHCPNYPRDSCQFHGFHRFVWFILDSNQNWIKCVVISKPFNSVRSFIQQINLRLWLCVHQNHSFISKNWVNTRIGSHSGIFKTIHVRNWWDRYDCGFATCKNRLHKSHFAILFSITILSNGKHNNLH